MSQVVAVVGPTGSGKTALALDLAENLNTEIISADSMQFYRGMEIGTGAPTPQELQRVRHHFVGHLAPSESMSAGAFEVVSRAVVAGLNARGKPAVVVGGSGLYVQALIDGLFDGPSQDPAVRERLEDEAEASGADRLYERLRRIDEAYANRIHRSDLRRIVRGLEVYELTGRPFSELHVEHREGAQALDALQVALDWPREVLYARINDRVDRMIEAGLVEEVRRLLEAGQGAHIDRLKSLGYREVAAHLRGDCTLEEAVSLMKMHTRRYAKRQLTWFKGDTRVHWIPVDGTETSTFRLEQCMHLVDESSPARL